MSPESVILVEACVTTLEEAIAASKAGAHRLELCAKLDEGGVTPYLELFNDILDVVELPICVMIRPRPGSFHMTPDEISRMIRDVERFADAGVDGLVVGVLDAKGEPDAGAIAELVDAAHPVPLVFHRAFDQCPDPLKALDVLFDAGIDRILTAGGTGTAWENRATLKALVAAAEGRLTIMAGGGIRADHVQSLIDETGVIDIHARASAIPGIVAALAEGG